MANGLEGGNVHGREGVRSYWTRQWAMIDPRADPVQIGRGGDGRIVVEVHQVARDLDGKILGDETVGHVLRIENGLIRRFDSESLELKAAAGPVLDLPRTLP